MIGFYIGLLVVGIVGFYFVVNLDGLTVDSSTLIISIWFSTVIHLDSITVVMFWIFLLMLVTTLLFDTYYGYQVTIR